MATILNTNNLAQSSSGQFLTALGINGTSATWASPTTNFTSSNGKALLTIPYGQEKVQIEEKATLEVKGTIVLNGMDLDERLKTIEQVLCIPQRDVTMEARHPKLKQLYEEYMHELAKYKTWDTLKDSK